jgi:hypothetical protein
MRDDDDHDDDPKELGRIYYSGINPDADRADYALPRGEPALHDGDVEFELEAPPTQESSDSVSPRKPRRKIAAMFLHAGLSLAVSVVFCTGFALGWSPGTNSPAREPLHATTTAGPVNLNLSVWANKLAVGPIANLIEYQKPFLATVEMQTQVGNGTLWRGVERLSRVAVVESPSERPAMIRRILRVIERPTAPEELDECVRDLHVALAEALEGR